MVFGLFGSLNQKGPLVSSSAIGQPREHGQRRLHGSLLPVFRHRLYTQVRAVLLLEVPQASAGGGESSRVRSTSTTRLAAGRRETSRVRSTTKLRARGGTTAGDAAKPSPAAKLPQIVSLLQHAAEGAPGCFCLSLIALICWRTFAVITANLRRNFALICWRTFAVITT